jgi:beta-N-acetylhexosaminidase
MRLAARWMRSASATEVPPNFITTVFAAAGAIRGNDSQAASFPAVPANPPRRSQLLLILLAGLALASAVTGAVLGARESDETDGDPVERARGESFLARMVPPPAGHQEAASLPPDVAGLVRRLPLERKVAQLFALGFEGMDSSADMVGRLRRLDAGAVVVAPHNYADPVQLEALTTALTETARSARHFPPFVLTSQEGGDLNALPGLPPAAPPADIASPAQAGAEALASGRALRGLGVTGVLGPVLDVGLESGSALGTRVYSDDPDEVAAYARRTVEAYRRASVFSSAAHMPGLGGADQATQDGPASVGLELDQLRERDLIPFEAAIAAGVPGVTLSHALYPFSDFTVPASLSPAVAGRLLRDELGFEGIALTDDLADPAITRLYTVPEAALEAVRAGADMLLISGPPRDQEAAYRAVLQAVRSGRISRARLDTAVGRILSVKRDYRLIR